MYIVFVLSTSFTIVVQSWNTKQRNISSILTQIVHIVIKVVSKSNSFVSLILRFRDLFLNYKIILASNNWIYWIAIEDVQNLIFSGGKFGLRRATSISPVADFRPFDLVNRVSRFFQTGQEVESEEMKIRLLTLINQNILHVQCFGFCSIIMS